MSITVIHYNGREVKRVSLDVEVPHRTPEEDAAFEFWARWNDSHASQREEEIERQQESARKKKGR